MQRSLFRALSGAIFPPASRAIRRAPAACRIAALLLALAPMATPDRAQAQTKPAPKTLASPAPEKPRKEESSGRYTDRAGTVHEWRINPQKTLIWDRAPYLPVGGTFAPRSFAAPADSAWQEDVAALSTLKAKGLLDLIIWPGKSLPDVPIAALQRLVDYLDANGFRYGLAFGSGLTTPLRGTIVKPASYRFADKDAVTATWQVPNADSGFVALADLDDDNKLIPARSGVVTVRDGLATVPIDTPTSSKVVALFYPHTAQPVTGDGVLPDLWAGFDEYRDRLLAYLGQAKFGPGLRFFLDPLARRIGLLNESDYIVPDSANFLLEWEGFLTRRYPNLEELKLAWSLNEGEFNTHHDLARLIPLWANGRGIPYFYDPSARRPYRILDADLSRWWQDFLQYRNESILYYLNAMAKVLKKQVADVPVVVTWTHSHPIFCNTDPSGGFDGLGIVARGDSLISRVAGPAYSEAEQAARTVWCLATEVIGNSSLGPTRAAGSQATTAALSAPQSGAMTVGYANSVALSHDLDSLRDIGIKGFFAKGFQTTPEDTNGMAEWLRSPDTLDWLKDYGTRFSRGRPEEYAPQLLFYPQSAPGPAHIGLIPNTGTPGVFWMESYYPGQLLDWWPSYSGYTIQKDGEASAETVLVSLQPDPKARDSYRRETHLWCNDAKLIRAFRPDGTPVPFKTSGKNILIIPLDETPTIFQTGGQPLIPQEAATDAMIQLSALMALAKSQKVPSADDATFSLDRAQYAYKQQDYDTAYTFARSALDRLTLNAQPYIWIEGESTPYHTFTEVAGNAAASSGGFLRLSSPNPPGRLGYGVFYLFNVPEERRYNIWVAGTPPGPGTSPIQWRINTEPAQDPADPRPRGPLYLNDRFGWFLLGSVNLKRGDNQRLTIYVVDRAQSPANYIFSIDAILITPQEFHPDGKVRPLPVDNPTIRGAMRDKRLFSR